MASDRGIAGGSMVAALGAFALSAIAMEARAQTAIAPNAGPPPTQTTTTPAQLTTQPTAATATEVEQVVVTARRRNESVQTTPVAVTAISPTQLANLAAPDIRDLAGRVPALVLDPVNSGPSAAAISIRGISFEDIEKSFDPAVGVLIDDVYIGTNTGQLTDAFDLKSIEVLRGPQGTLFGRNTIGGVISIQRTRPTGVLGGTVDAEFGDYGREDYHAVLNLPKVFDQLSTKLFYSNRNTDGYEYNATLGRQTPNDNIQRYGVDLLWQPTSAFDLNLTVEHAEEHGEVDQAALSNGGDLICLRVLPAPLNGPPFESPSVECNRNTGSDLYTTYSNKPGTVSNNENDITAQATARLGWVTLTSITAYRGSHEFVAQDFDASSINFFDTERSQNYQQFSQEIRATGDIIKNVDYVAGIYYFKSHYDLNQVTNYGPLLRAAAGLPATSLHLVDHESLSYAGFGDVNWRFAPKWRITVGGRYSDDRKRLDNDYPGALGFPTNASKSFDEFTPKASIDYEPNSNLLYYLSYSKGYRSGGFNGRGADVVASTTPYNPETVDSYEVGAKTEWFSRRLTFNVSAYDNEYDNKQEEVVSRTPPGSPDPEETLVANAASARIYGIEFESQAQPTAALSLRANLSLLNASYDNFSQIDATYPQLTDDLSNLQLRRAPGVTGDVGFDYKFPEQPFGRFTLTSDYRYIAAHTTVITPAPGTGVYTGAGCATATSAGPSCVYIPAVNDPRGRAQPTNTLDAALNWDHDLPIGTVRISIYGRNITDNRGLASALAVAGLFTFGEPRPPRTYGVQIGYKF